MGIFMIFNRLKKGGGSQVVRILLYVTYVTQYLRQLVDKPIFMIISYYLAKYPKYFYLSR